MAEIFATGQDCGTMNLVAVRDDNNGGFVLNEVRNCYRELEEDDELEIQLASSGTHFIKSDNRIYILGNDALANAKMAELGGQSGKEEDILKRPMKDGIINPDNKISLVLFRELMKACIERNVGNARTGEILYYSIPANPASSNDSNINNTFHSKSIQRYLEGLGYDARPLNEALAVVFAENPKMHSPEGDVALTGIAISFGAGQANFCLAERGVSLDEFSVVRSGDWLDTQVARATGQPKVKCMRVKETKLNFNNIDESEKNSDILIAYDMYYDELLSYIFDIFVKKYAKNRGSIEYPLDIVLAGGTACPDGFDKKVRKILNDAKLPFEIGEIKLAGGGDKKKMLQSVAKGCYLRAKQAAKKANEEKAKK